MILLMGGTSESPLIADALVDAGYDVLVSMATEVPLSIPERQQISVRRGRLNHQQLVSLIASQGITALVDAMHPYAEEAHATAKSAAAEAAIAYLRYVRSETDLAAYPNVHTAANHLDAAKMAVSFRKPILLTIGSRNLPPYLTAAREANLPIHARVLPCHDSQPSCREVGLQDDEVTQARGPFSVQDTLELLRSREIGTVVTKESGDVGGVPEKLEAAAIAQCEVVLVRRASCAETSSCQTVEGLIDHLRSEVQ